MRLSPPRRGSLSFLLLLTLAAGLVACGGSAGSEEPRKKRRFGVESVDPIKNAVSVELDAPVVVTFTDPISGDTHLETSFEVTMRALGTHIPGDYELGRGNLEIVFTPSVDYARNTQYKVRVRDVISVAGEELREEFVSYFRTAVMTEPPPPPPPPEPTARIRTVGRMISGHSSHQATLLPSGRVLVTGGFDTSSTVTLVAETYDPVTEEFTRTPTDPAIPRGFHSAVRLGDGTVLVTGGVTGTSLLETDHAEIYGSDTGVFATLGSRMVHPRSFHTTTLLQDGRVLVAGGAVPTATGVFSSRTTEIFDPATGSFSALPDMAVYRAGHTATLMPDGRVLLAGGNSTDLRAELFDPAANGFVTVAGEMKRARRGHSANLLADGTVLIMGGGDRTGELFVADKDYFRWTPGYPLYDRKDHSANLLPSGRVFFAGGSRIVGGVVFFNRTTEYYAPTSGAFLGSTLNLANPVTRHRATTLANGDVLITGGSNLDPTQPELRTAELYETLD